MKVRHNTTLLEKAVDETIRRASLPSLKAQADAAATIQRASSLRRLATGIAIGIAAVGLGVGIYWAKSSKFEIKTVSIPSERPKDSATAPSAQDASQNNQKVSPDRPPKDEAVNPVVAEPNTNNVTVPAAETIDTTNFTIFRNRSVVLGPNNLLIQAGHSFKTEQDQKSLNWERAWCYTTLIEQGIEFKFDLGNRASSLVAPSYSPLSQAALDKAKLTEFEAATLASKCPWLDEKNFSVDSDTFTKNPDKSAFTLQGTTLVFRGPISKGFASLIPTYNFEALEIESPGGLVDEAIVAGKYLRSRQKLVRVKRECLSACVFVLAGGVLRTAEDSAHIGVHRFFKDAAADIGDVQLGQQKSAEVLEYLQSMGMSDELWFTMSKTPAETMRYLDHTTLRTWRVLSAPEVEIPDTSSVDDVGTSQDISVSKELNPDTKGTGDAFRRVLDRDSPGFDFPDMPISGLSELQCQVKCQGINDCVALTYNTFHRACFLKSGASQLVAFKGAVTYYRERIHPQLKP